MDLPGIFEGYKASLCRQPLARKTREAYRERARVFFRWLEDHPPDIGDPLRDLHARDYAVRDFKVYLKKERKAAPRTVNLTLAALDHFYRFLGLGPPDVRREELPAEAPRALEPDELKRFLRAAEKTENPRDRTLALLLLHTGIRLGELVSLDVDDVTVTARKGRVVVRSGKGDRYREIPLNSEARTAVDEWLVERRERFTGIEEKAFFLSRLGKRLSARSVDAIVRKLGREVGVEVSAHVLRHTCLTRLVRAGNDLVLVSEIAGHRKLETTRRYSLPSSADREAAMETIRMEY